MVVPLAVELLLKPAPRWVEIADFHAFFLPFPTFRVQLRPRTGKSSRQEKPSTANGSVTYSGPAENRAAMRALAPLRAASFAP